MNANTRVCVAYISAGLSGLVKVTALYDHTETKPLNVSGTVRAGNIDVYNFDRTCHVSGNLENLYDYGNNALIQITVNGDNFSGKVEKGVVSLYDYQTEVYYRYS